MAMILKRLLEVMRQNAPGIIADIDTECLHDFRVAVRRTRAALVQIKKAFPREVIKPFKLQFADLGKASNRLRDLDIFLLKKGSYEAALPPEYRSQLSALYESLQVSRDQEYRDFVAVLKGAACRSLLLEWETFLDSPPANDPESQRTADTPIIDLVRKRILKQYSRVTALGGTVDVSTSEAAIHALRIQCKNLRYLFELFSSLFPGEKALTLTRQLKSLQDDLGEYNDLHIQQLRLRDYMPRSETAAGDTVETAAAIGGLITTMYRRQQVVKDAFQRTFKEFSGPESAALYRELFE